MAGSLKLSDLRFEQLDVTCRKCPTRARLSVAKLLRDHGDMPLPDLRQILAVEADCGRSTSDYHDQCGIYYPQLGHVQR